MNQIVTTGQLDKLDALLQQLPQTVLPLVHEFCDGLYARTIFMPADTIVTSQTHKCDSIALVRYGLFKMTTDEGVQTFSTGDLMITKAGARRALHIIEDTCFVTVHANPTNEQDPEELWSLFTNPQEKGELS